VQAQNSILIEALYDSLNPICKQIINELLNSAYVYSLQSLIADTARFIQSSLTGLSPEGKIKIRVEADMLSKILEIYNNECFLTLLTFLDILRVTGEEVSKEHAEKIFNRVIYWMRKITNDIINDWLVAKFREAGKINAKIFDNYNIFKDKWNSLLNKLEQEASKYGLSISYLERAKEPGVPVA